MAARLNGASGGRASTGSHVLLGISSTNCEGVFQVCLSPRSCSIANCEGVRKTIMDKCDRRCGNAGKSAQCFLQNLLTFRVPEPQKALYLHSLRPSIVSPPHRGRLVRTTTPLTLQRRSKGSFRPSFSLPCMLHTLRKTSKIEDDSHA